MLHADLTDRILGCLVDVHKALGPGLPENTYQAASSLEMTACGLRFVREPPLTVTYRNVVVGHHRPDFIVEEKVVLELKCVSCFMPVFTTQVLTYLRLSGLKVGLLVNFYAPTLGIKRLAL